MTTYCFGIYSTGHVTMFGFATTTTRQRKRASVSITNPKYVTAIVQYLSEEVPTDLQFRHNAIINNFFDWIQYMVTLSRQCCHVPSSDTCDDFVLDVNNRDGKHGHVVAAVLLRAQLWYMLCYCFRCEQQRRKTWSLCCGSVVACPALIHVMLLF